MEAQSNAFSPQKVEAFLGRVVSDFGAAFGVTLAYIGDKLGLYKAMAFAGPLSSEEVAERSATNERYVREWLINQAAGGYLEYDADSGKYNLPDEHAIALTDENAPNSALECLPGSTPYNPLAERVSSFTIVQRAVIGETKMTTALIFFPNMDMH